MEEEAYAINSRIIEAATPALGRNKTNFEVFCFLEESLPNLRGSRLFHPARHADELRLIAAGDPEFSSCRQYYEGWSDDDLLKLAEYFELQ